MGNKEVTKEIVSRQDNSVHASFQTGRILRLIFYKRSPAGRKCEGLRMGSKMEQVK